MFSFQQIDEPPIARAQIKKAADARGHHLKQHYFALFAVRNAICPLQIGLGVI